MTKNKQASETPSADAVRSQLATILVAAPFVSSPVLSRFLSHIVEHALNTDGGALKEFAVGVEVFDRTSDYDPRIDTIVRVQARRLRAALKAYYDGPGCTDPIRIEMPKGHYGARFSRTTTLPDKPPSNVSANADADAIEAIGAGTVPAPRNRLIGRASELELIVERLSSNNVRLLTLTGVGGSGKTRLAIELAWNLRSAFPGGVLFLDLSALTERSALISVLAEAFNVRRTEGRPLVDAVSGRLRALLGAPTLLVLDNFEGVLESADVVGSLLDASAQLTVLTTSRLALHVYGENEYPLAPLAIPARDEMNDPATLIKVPSVQLFMDRAAGVQPHWQLEPEHAGMLAELCICLDGLPLAIELVAAQAGTMTPTQMLQRFTGHLDLPANQARDAPFRQRTLRRTIDWSHDLLNETGRRVLRRLAVFSGSFTIEAAEAVADVDADIGADLLPTLSTLVSMGLLYFRTENDGPRYAMLETLRAYGHERLNASGESDRMRKAHAAYCLILAEEGIAPMERDQGDAWLSRCDQEQANFRLALDFLLKNGPHEWALRLAQALFAYWERREMLIEGEHRLRHVVDTLSPDINPTLWAKVFAYATTMAALQGDQMTAKIQFMRLLEHYRHFGDKKGEAATLNAIAVAERIRQDEASARPLLVQALELCRAIGNRSEIAASLSNLAECEVNLGNTESAQAQLMEAHALFTAENDLVPAAWCLNHLGDSARVQGEHARAAELYVQAQAEFARLGDRWGMTRSLADRGRLALDRGDHEQAGPLLLQALVWFESLKHRRGAAAVADTLADYALASSQPDLAVKLLAAAESWRSAVGFTSRPDNLKYAEVVRRKAQASMDAKSIAALKVTGGQLSPGDVADLFQALVESNADPKSID